MGKLFAVVLVIIALASAYPIVTHMYVMPEDISTHGHQIDEQLSERGPMSISHHPGRMPCKSRPRRANSLFTSGIQASMASSAPSIPTRSTKGTRIILAWTPPTRSNRAMTSSRRSWRYPSTAKST